MADSNYFIFNSIDSRTYNIWINDVDVYGAPAASETVTTIPGRNGALILAEGSFKEIDHIYKCFVTGSTAATTIASFRNAMLQSRGYQRLTDSFNSGEFYKARFAGGIDVKPTPRATAMVFNVKLKRDPRRFLTSGESVTTLTATGSISNPTLYEARPILRVYGTGTVKIGNDTITISTNASYTDIDCDLRECYRGSTNLNANVSLSGLDFPALKAGSNTVTLSGVTKVEITPRWWQL